MSKKIALIADSEGTLKRYRSGGVKAAFQKMAEKFDLEFKEVLDLGLECEGDDWVSAAMKIEKQGPGWVKHDPKFLEEIADAEIIVVSFSAVGEELLNAAKNLKLVAVMRSGVENIDVKACNDRGIMVCNAPGRLLEPVSDMACALIMDLNRGITYVSKHPEIEEGELTSLYYMPQLMRDWTIGIVGFGFIGQAVARKLSGFGCRFIAYDPFVSQEVADKLNTKMVSLEEVMSESDVVTIHARLLDATQNMVNADMIAKMKPSAFFVNTARAGLVDEDALVKALQEKKICGAALDVTSVEPLPEDHPLNKLENVILTPHMSGMSGDSFAITAGIITEQISMFLSGDKPSALVK